MVDLLHAEIDVIKNTTLRIKSQCAIDTSLTKEELKKTGWRMHPNRKRRKRQIYCHAGL